jgi:hypothetical protein
VLCFRECFIIALKWTLNSLYRSKKKLFMIYGKWTECLWGIDPGSYESFKKHERRGDHPRKPRLVSAYSQQTLLEPGVGEGPLLPESSGFSLNFRSPMRECGASWPLQDTLCVCTLSR